MSVCAVPAVCEAPPITPRAPRACRRIDSECAKPSSRSPLHLRGRQQVRTLTGQPPGRPPAGDNFDRHVEPLHHPRERLAVQEQAHHLFDPARELQRRHPVPKAPLGAFVDRHLRQVGQVYLAQRDPQLLVAGGR